MDIWYPSVPGTKLRYIPPTHPFDYNSELKRCIDLIKSHMEKFTQNINMLTKTYKVNPQRYTTPTSSSSNRKTIANKVTNPIRTMPSSSNRQVEKGQRRNDGEESADGESIATALSFSDMVTIDEAPQTPEGSYAEVLKTPSPSPLPSSSPSPRSPNNRIQRWIQETKTENQKPSPKKITTRSTQRAQTTLAEADHYSHIAHCKNVQPWWWKTTPLKKKKEKKKGLDHYLHHNLGMLQLLSCFFAHLLILECPDHHQNLISSSLYYPGPRPKISS